MQGISPTPSLFVAQRPSTYSATTPRGTWGNFGETRGGVGKNGALEHKSGNIYETRTDTGKVTMGSYSKSPSLFRTVPSPTPYGLPFPKIGGSQPPPKTPIAIISGTDKATDLKFDQYIHKVHRNKSPLRISGKVAVGENFQGTHI